MTTLALTYAAPALARTRLNATREPIIQTYASAQTREIKRAETEHWERDAGARLVHLMSLNVGWDGSDSPAVRSEIATFAWSALSSIMTSKTPIPFIAPVSGGGVQLEWHTDGLDIELYIPQPSKAELYIEYQDGREPVEEDITSDFESLSSAIREIS